MTIAFWLMVAMLVLLIDGITSRGEFDKYSITTLSIHTLMTVMVGVATFAVFKNDMVGPMLMILPLCESAALAYGLWEIVRAGPIYVNMYELEVVTTRDKVLAVLMTLTFLANVVVLSVLA